MHNGRTEDGPDAPVKRSRGASPVATGKGEGEGASGGKVLPLDWRERSGCLAERGRVSS